MCEPDGWTRTRRVRFGSRQPSVAVRFDLLPGAISFTLLHGGQKTSPPFQSWRQMQQTFRLSLRGRPVGGIGPDRTPVAVIPSCRLRRPQSLTDCHPEALCRDEPGRETIYRRHFSAMARTPIFLAVLVGLSLAFDPFRYGSSQPFWAALVLVFGAFIVTLSLFWSILMWYGNYVRISERNISINTVDFFFRSSVRAILWGEIKDISMSGGLKCLGSGDIYLIVGEGRSLRISNIPEPEYLYAHMRTKLSH